MAEFERRLGQTQDEAAGCLVEFERKLGQMQEEVRTGATPAVTIAAEAKLIASKAHAALSSSRQLSVRTGESNSEEDDEERGSSDSEDASDTLMQAKTGSMQEMTQADLEGAGEYPIAESVWDCSLFAGIEQLELGVNAILVFLTVSNMAVQLGFVYIVRTYMLSDPCHQVCGGPHLPREQRPCHQVCGAEDSHVSRCPDLQGEFGLAFRQRWY